MAQSKRKKRPKRDPSQPRRAVTYSRCSTQEQAQSGLGVSAQKAKCRSYCATFDHVLVEEVDENGVSGSLDPAERPVLGPILRQLDEGVYDLLIVAKLDRLGRSTADVLAVADRALANGWDLALLDLQIDTSTPTGRLILTVLASIAEFEREQIRQRTKDALRVLKSKGVKVGRPVTLPAKTRRRVVALRKKGLSLNATAKTLEQEGTKTAQGGRWTAMTISKIETSLRLEKEARAASKRPGGE